MAVAVALPGRLRDDDRSVRLVLAVPLYAAILHAHLARHDQAIHAIRVIA